MRLAELEQKLFEQTNEEATATQLKRVMNRVFHSLREEFGLQETYTGSTVLKLAVNTIKNVTLHFLADLNDIPAEADDEREEGDEEEEDDDEGDASHGESLQDSKIEGQVVRQEKTTKVDVGEVYAANTNPQAEKSNKETTEGSSNGVIESQESSSPEEVYLDTQTTPAEESPPSAQTQQ
ncbi:FK506-binding protein 15-like [Sardina pilchardus]|uniref:FK506-binding protein 15-like n=1 Tax=Sardina pilchardus TaxID=27697 RepID=UPI002E0F6F19